ncbi:MAG: hypothetical protein AAF493_24170 [Pseudomonadota bacterium]
MKKYIDRYSANGSRLFWAAFGARTDGRDNERSEYQPTSPSYAGCTTSNPKECGYRFSDIHAEEVALCQGSDPAGAAWVYQLGQWIDHHAPVDTASDFTYHHDRYHPSVDMAILGGKDCEHPQFFNVGFWDDRGALAALNITINGASWIAVDDPDELANGFYPVHLGGVDISRRRQTVVGVEATDASGNRQTSRFTVAELITQCVASGGKLPGPTPNVTKKWLRAKPVSATGRTKSG